MKDLDKIIKRNLVEIEKLTIKNKDLFLEVDTSTNIGGRKYECVDEGRRCYFKFSEFGKVMFVPQYTTLYYLNRYPKTSEILNLNRTNIDKDEYGYYETIYVPAYGENVRRYFPIENWSGWNFIKDQDIPFAIETRDGSSTNLYTLTLALVDPVSSVVGISNPDKKDKKLPKGVVIEGGPEVDQNPSRGWIISGAGKLTNQPQDSGTGYYKIDNGQFVAYNVTGPIDRYNESTWVGSDSTEAVRFWDSGTGIFVQIGLSIVVTVLLRMPIAVSLGASLEITAASTAALRTRLIIATIITESMVNLPIAMVYFNNPGDDYDNAGWISILFCLLPLAQGTLMKNIIGDFSNATAWSLAQKIVQKRIGQTATQAELELFFKTCTFEEKYLAIRAIRAVEKKGGQEALEKLLNTVGVDELEKLFKRNFGNITKQPSFIKAAGFIEEQFKYQPGFWQSLGLDFASTLGFGKFMGKILDDYQKSLVKKGETPATMTEEEKKKMEEKIKNLSKQFEGLPKSLMEELNDDNVDVVSLQFVLSDEDKEWMIKNGKMGPLQIGKLASWLIKKYVIKTCDDIFVKDSGIEGGYALAEDGKRQINPNIDGNEFRKMLNDISLWGLYNTFDKEAKRIADLYRECLPQGGYFFEGLDPKNYKKREKPKTPVVVTPNTETQNVVEPPKWTKVSEEDVMKYAQMEDLYYILQDDRDPNKITYYVISKVDLSKQYTGTPISSTIDLVTDPNLAPTNLSSSESMQQLSNPPQTINKSSGKFKPSGRRIRTN